MSAGQPPPSPPRVSRAANLGQHTPRERRVIELTRELAVEYRRLEDHDGAIHPSHGRDVADAIHVVQRIVAIRLAKRTDPAAWR